MDDTAAPPDPPDPPDPAPEADLPAAGAAARRVRHRVLARVAEDRRDYRHLTVHANEGDWQPFGPGLLLKVLHERDGVLSYLVRLAPGAVLPAHRHPIDEECVVLEGALRVGDLVVGAGGWHLGRQHLPHARIESPEGALIFLRGAVPEASQLL